MIVVDTSAWIELLRGDAGPELRSMIRSEADQLATTGPVVMEVLAGSRTPEQHDTMLAALHQRMVDPDLDYKHAADIYRAVRRSGHTPRSLNDCLIAAVALRFDDVVAHRDIDFERVAEVTGLRQRRV